VHSPRLHCHIATLPQVPVATSFVQASSETWQHRLGAALAEYLPSWPPSGLLSAKSPWQALAPHRTADMQQIKGSSTAPHLNIDSHVTWRLSVASGPLSPTPCRCAAPRSSDAADSNRGIHTPLLGGACLLPGNWMPPRSRPVLAYDCTSLQHACAATGRPRCPSPQLRRACHAPLHHCT
jgi:hypothetical protein